MPVLAKRLGNHRRFRGCLETFEPHKHNSVIHPIEPKDQFPKILVNREQQRCPRYPLFTFSPEFLARTSRLATLPVGSLP